MLILFSCLCFFLVFLFVLVDIVQIVEIEGAASSFTQTAGSPPLLYRLSTLKNSVCVSSFDCVADWSGFFPSWR